MSMLAHDEAADSDDSVFGLNKSSNCDTESDRDAEPELDWTVQLLWQGCFGFSTVLTLLIIYAWLTTNGAHSALPSKATLSSNRSLSTVAPGYLAEDIKQAFFAEKQDHDPALLNTTTFDPPPKTMMISMAWGPMKHHMKGRTFLANKLDGGSQMYTIDWICGTGQCNMGVFEARGEDGKEYAIKFAPSLKRTLKDLGVNLKESSADENAKLKIINGGHPVDESAIEHEIEIMEMLTEKSLEDKVNYIPKLVSSSVVFGKNHFRAMVLEKAKGDTVQELLQSEAKVDWTTFNTQLDQMMTWFSQKGVIVLDFKIDHVYYNPSTHQIMRIDFGIAKRYTGDNWPDVCEFVNTWYSTPSLKAHVVEPNTFYDIYLDPETYHINRRAKITSVMRISFAANLYLVSHSLPTLIPEELFDITHGMVKMPRPYKKTILSTWLIIIIAIISVASIFIVFYCLYRILDNTELTDEEVTNESSIE